MYLSTKNYRTIVCTQETDEPPVRAILRHPPALALCLSPHRHLFTSSPLALSLSAIINKPHAFGLLAVSEQLPFHTLWITYRRECRWNTKVCTLCSDFMLYRHILMWTSRLLVVLHFIRPHTLTSSCFSRRLPSREALKASGFFRIFILPPLKRWKQFASFFTILSSQYKPNVRHWVCYTTVRYGH